MLELNASDERGISVVRTKIKDFACIAVGAPAPGYPSPPYKLLILDEADAMTEDAQNALRRTMETHSKVTRFCFICNYISRIIDPIASRCAKFRCAPTAALRRATLRTHAHIMRPRCCRSFKPVPMASMSSRLAHICSCEGLTLDGGTMEALSACAGGDMRKAITLLQCAARLHGAAVSPASVEEAAGTVPLSAVRPLLAALRPGAAAGGAAQFDAVQRAVGGLIKAGYPALQVMAQLADALWDDDGVSDAAKAAVAARMASADKALADGADEALQLLDVAATAQRALCGLPPVAESLVHR